MSLCPLSHWRHGSKVPMRALSLDEKQARHAELRSSHTRVALSKALRVLVRDAELYYREVFGESLTGSIAPGLTRNRHDVEPTAQPAPFLGSRSMEGTRA